MHTNFEGPLSQIKVGTWWEEGGVRRTISQCALHPAPQSTLTPTMCNLPSELRFLADLLDEITLATDYTFKTTDVQIACVLAPHDQLMLGCRFHEVCGHMADQLAGPRFGVFIRIASQVWLGV